METTNAVDKRTGREVGSQEPTRAMPRYRPLVDIEEHGDELRMIAEVPGARPEDIDINYEKGILTLHARVKPRQPDSVNYLIREYGIGDYYRAFEVSETIDASQISADYSDGVLVLHLPKAEKAKARKVEVRAR
jgi:HSP20 family protein